MTPITFVEPLTGIGGHALCFDMIAMGACQRRVQHHGVHFASATKVDG